MRFAVISDIHGNLPALDVVLRDAWEHGAESYIFAGDYCLSGPYPGGCIEAVRNTENKYIIRGNEERYLENLVGKDQNSWTDGQMQISYWCFRNISEDDLDYILKLPHTVDLECCGINIHIAHSSDPFIGSCESELFGPAVLAERYADISVTPERLRGDIHDSLEKSAFFQKAVPELADGVYIFGHSHVQWSYKPENRDIYLINPGSCGLPLDGINGSVPYTLLDISGGGNIQITERRLPFDKKGYIRSLICSAQYTEANVWSRVIIKELLTAKEHLTFFLMFAEKYARSINDVRRPYVAETWEKAYKLWEQEIEKGDTE